MKLKYVILAALLCGSIKGFAQQTNEATGTVVDRWKKPVSGALVTIKGNTITKVMTDKDGKFEISALPGDKLEIYVPEFGKQTVEVKDNAPIDITIDFAAEAVDRGWGIEQTLSESTAAISRSTFDDVNKRSSLNAANTLFGNALGLTTLQNSGNAWEDVSTFYIRGLKTLSNNNILVLVDGFERSLQYIVSEEIESVSVLRDAAAVALYGYKGVNGILSIKTKRGKYNTRDINISYDHAITSQIRKPEFADAYTYANAMNEALANDGKAARYSQNELNAFKSGAYPYLYPNVDWVNEVLRDHGATNIYNLNFRGGGKKMRYYTMLNLQGNEGFVKKTKATSYPSQMRFYQGNIRTNLDIDLSSTTWVQVNLQGVIEEFNRPALSSTNLMGKLYTVPSAAFPIKTENGKYFGGNSTWGSGMNPVAIIQGMGYSKGHTRSLLADMKINQRLDFITKGLSTAFRVGYDNTASYWEGRTKSYEYTTEYVKEWNADGTPKTIGLNPIQGKVSEMGFDSRLDWQKRQFNFVGNVDYQKTLDRSNKLFASLIYSYEMNEKNGQHNTYYRQNVAGYFHYGLMDRYFADLTLMASGSNKLAPGHKWAFSPTLAAAWVISKENFMKNVDFIDFLKLRASFGIVNYDGIPGENYWEQNYGGGSGYFLADNNESSSGGIQEGRLPNIGSTHEKAYKYNVGVDAAFLKGFTFTADTYYEKRKDIFVTPGTVSSVLGVSSTFANGGVVDSWGTELGLNYFKKLGDVSLSVGGKFTFNKNEIKEKLESPKAEDYLYEKGHPVNQIFGLQAIGYFVDQADIDNSPIQQFAAVKPGDIKYKDQNGDGLINENDRIALGYNTVVPEIYYSFDLGVEWKGLGVSATFQGVGNYSAVLNTQSMFLPLVNNTTISNHYYENRWTPETPFAKYPRLTTEKNDNNYRTNSVWLADRSFLKLRNCEMYYKLPLTWISKLKMKNAKVYVRGVDLLCFDKIDIADPESYGATFPLTRSVNFGITIGF